MLIVSKLFNYLILPPGGILLLLTGLLVLLAIKRSRVAAIICASAIFLLYIFSISPVSRVLLKPLEHAFPPLQARSPSGMRVALEISPDGSTVQGAADWHSSETTGDRTNDTTGTNKITESAQGILPEGIVVLGGGVVGNNGAVGPHELLADGALPRYVHAYKLHRETGLPVYLTGGAVFDTQDESSAEVGKRFLEGIGVSPDSIFIEGESRNTWENAAELKYRFELDSVYLVTSAYHMMRSAAVFETQGFTVIPSPTGYVSDGAPFNFWDFMPSSSSLDDSFKALHEYVGLVYYKVRYGI